MPIDFRATNIQTQKIIASGSIASSGRSQIAVYPIESQDPGTPHQGVILPEVLENIISTDIFFYVSGAIGSKGGSTHGAAVFGGDLHISGNLTVDGTSPGGGGSGDSFWALTGSTVYTTSSVLINNTMYMSGNTFSGGSAPDKVEMTIQGYHAGVASGDDGVNVYVFAGDNDQTTTNAGSIIIQGGYAYTDGFGGGVSVYAGGTDAPGNDAGYAELTGGDHDGDSLSAGNGGVVFVGGGDGYAAGGDVTINAGDSWGGHGANVTIAASNASSDQVESNKNGGSISFTTGNGFDGGNGGDLTIILGSGENSNRTIAGGSLFVSGGASIAGPGGSLNFQAGGDDGQGASVGGDIVLQAGHSLNGTGGDVFITAGTGSSAYGNAYVYVNTCEVTASSTVFTGQVGVGRNIDTGDANNVIAIPHSTSLASRDFADTTDIKLITLTTSFFGDKNSISIGDGDTTSIFMIPGPGIINGAVLDSGSFSFGPKGFSVTNDIATIFNENSGDDIYFFVSGSTNSRGTATRGTAVFGGDLHISGNLSIDGTGGGGSAGAVNIYGNVGFFGGQRLIPTFVSGNFTASKDMYFLPVSASTALTIAISASSDGQAHIIKDAIGSAATNNIVVSSSSGLIDGYPTYTINATYSSFTFVYVQDLDMWSVI